MNKLILEFSDDELAALKKLAAMELRSVELQAADVIRKELERRGLLEGTVTVTESGTRKTYQILED